MNDTEYERLMAAALRFISFRPRSEKEIRNFCTKTLKRHHTTAPLVVSKVLERLTELGYVDDRKFAEWWIGQRTTSTPRGKRAIEAELKAKGIACPDIRIDERELAKKAVAKKLVHWQKFPPLERKKKIVGFLYRRGFDMSLVDDIGEKE